MSTSAKVTLMPLNYNGLDLLKQTLPKLKEAASRSSHEVDVVVVDNASRDGSLEWLQQNHPEVGLMAFAENKILSTYNEAFQKCSSPYIMILNNDVFVDVNFIDPLVERLESEPDAFGVSPQIQADLEHEVWENRLGGRFFHGHLAGVKLGKEPGGTLFCHGAAMLVRRDLFIELGGFDPLFFYQEDNDLSYRAWRKGYRCLFEPSASVHHMGSQTVLKEKGGLEGRRAAKERANHFFVLKNVQNGAWKMNFYLWSLLKAMKMIMSLDTKRFWAFRETLQHYAALKKRSRVQPKLDDEVLMSQIQNMRLSSLEDLK